MNFEHEKWYHAIDKIMKHQSQDLLVLLGMELNNLGPAQFSAKLLFMKSVCSNGRLIGWGFISSVNFKHLGGFMLSSSGF